MHAREAPAPRTNSGWFRDRSNPVHMYVTTQIQKKKKIDNNIGPFRTYLHKLHMYEYFYVILSPIKLQPHAHIS